MTHNHMNLQGITACDVNISILLSTQRQVVLRLRMARNIPLHHHIPSGTTLLYFRIQTYTNLCIYATHFLQTLHTVPRCFGRWQWIINGSTSVHDFRKVYPFNAFRAIWWIKFKISTCLSLQDSVEVSPGAEVSYWVVFSNCMSDYKPIICQLFGTSKINTISKYTHLHCPVLTWLMVPHHMYSLTDVVYCVKR